MILKEVKADVYLPEEQNQPRSYYNKKEIVKVGKD